MVMPTPRKSEATLRRLAVDLGAALADAGTLKPLPVEAGEDEDVPETPDGEKLLDELRLLRQDLDAYLTAPIDERDPIHSLRRRVDDALEA